MSFHENLRYYRERKGYSIKYISDLLGITPNTYAGYEIRGREPKYKTLIKISDILDVSIDELMRPQRHRFDRYILNLLNKDSEFKIGE